MPELSSILLTWRERLPNVWEDLPAWNDLVSWRNHMFSHINNVLGRVADASKSQLGSLGFQARCHRVVRVVSAGRTYIACESLIQCRGKAWRARV